MSALFSKPSIPTPPVAAPTALPPPNQMQGQNALLNAQLSQLGRRQGLVAALFGAKTPAGSSTGKKLTGE